ncbi:MAG TPA: tetratricopeptide repeat protein [Gemmatimonadales bacterium]|nr:tetratricopeptide repeat protein [Gemmatimonadales bacterium]
MHRPLYLVGFGYLAICGAVVLRHRASPSVAPAHVSPPAVAGFGGSAGEWFAAMKPYCNAVEVELAQRQHPPPATLEGQGLSAACYALGGKIDQARGIISELPTQDRYRAVGIVFNVAHPVADAGDDRSAGPIMELVLEYWPNHYMALYHAGMSEYALGQLALARTHLQSFLVNYHENDGWTRNAREVLARLR